MNDNETADPENHTEPQPVPEAPQADQAEENVGESAKKQDMAKVLARLGIDLPYLQTLPRGTHGRPWPAAWKLATKLLYVSGGYSSTDIARIMPDGPRKETIRDWLDVENWQIEREKFVKAVGARAMKETGEDQAATFARHVKALRAAQSAASMAIINKQVEGKSLEGVIGALAAAVKLERSILGLEHAPKATVPDNRSQSLMAELSNVAPEHLKEYFEAMRVMMQAKDRLRELAAGSVMGGEAAADEVVDRGEPGGLETPEEDAIQGMPGQVAGGKRPRRLRALRPNRGGAIG